MFVKSRDIKKAKLMMYLIPSAQKRTEWLKKNKVFQWEKIAIIIQKIYTCRTIFTLIA